ncbi:Hypothetical_protein [Hexamita inflata]|uniref:Hypothetical_protein n=1 Tax=Hexamita inflata TaxID=28002 RepID=A0AA86QW38_9EUKA|nr:Hypothetical protein HINF_LOCUS52888 [Hexamita inflata]
MLIIFLFSQQQMINSDIFVPDYVLINQVDQNITLKTNMSMIIYAMVPSPIITQQGPINYSQMVFQAQLFINECIIYFDQVGNGVRYSTLTKAEIITFPIHISTEESVFVKITSSCDVQINLVAIAIHDFNHTINSLTHMSPENTYFVQQRVPGVTKKSRFYVNTEEIITIWVCSTPIILNRECDGIEYQMLDTKEMDITVWANSQAGYIYYSVKTEGNKEIVAKSLDVVELDVNSTILLQLEPEKPNFFKIVNYMESNAFFEVTSIDPNVSICVTNGFTYKNENCLLIINQTGKTNLTQETKYFLVQSKNDSGLIAFNIGVKKIVNKQWIIWTSVSVAVVVVAVGIVFMYCKHKKIMGENEFPVQNTVNE